MKVTDFGPTDIYAEPLEQITSAEGPCLNCLAGSRRDEMLDPGTAEYWSTKFPSIQWTSFRESRQLTYMFTWGNSSTKRKEGHKVHLWNKMHIWLLVITYVEAKSQIKRCTVYTFLLYCNVFLFVKYNKHFLWWCVCVTLLLTSIFSFEYFYLSFKQLTV